MDNHIEYNNHDHISFALDPFSKREAWYWLEEQGGFSNEIGKVHISIRSLAYIWKWHRSKVERFLKKLKGNKLIETKICLGKTVICIGNSRDSGVNSSKIETKPRHNQNINRDSNELQIETLVTKEKQGGINSCNAENETKSRQLVLVGSTKKEKNQKKESFEVYSIKEKTSPYGRVKKENCESLQSDVEQVSADAVSEFASSLAIEPMQLEWELGKFKDYWLASSKKPPKNGVAAFRNWLRKSIEFKKERKNYERFGKARTTKTSFERFLAGGARAVAEYERNKLDGKSDGYESALFSIDSCYQEGFRDVSPE